MEIERVIVGAEFSQYVVDCVNNAKKSIEILIYDWRWYENQPAHAVQQFNIAIAQACARGVLVRAILNDDRILPTLIKIGVKAKTLKDHRTLHAKLIKFDNETMIIGSHNLTSNAFSRNLELSIHVKIPQTNNRIAQYFETLYNL